jgi:hypothetical protein
LGKERRARGDGLARPVARSAPAGETEERKGREEGKGGLTGGADVSVKERKRKKEAGDAGRCGRGRMARWADWAKREVRSFFFFFFFFKLFSNQTFSTQIQPKTFQTFFTTFDKPF